MEIVLLSPDLYKMATAHPVPHGKCDDKLNRRPAPEHPNARGIVESGGRHLNTATLRRQDHANELNDRRHDMEIRLPNLVSLISRCWKRAEDATVAAVEKIYFAPAEEQLTFLFTRHLHSVFQHASDRREFERAFVADLRSRFPNIADRALRWATGLIARVNLHSHRHEGGHSAADIGIIIKRPSIEAEGIGSTPRINIASEYARALLVQAKLATTVKRRCEDVLRWGSLTKKQKQLIPNRRDYYALLLYQLEDGDGRILAPFRWQVCRTYGTEEITNWLRTGTFPNAIDSVKLIRELGAGHIGTDDQQIINSIIDPPKTRGRAIEIKIYWRDGKVPPKQIEVDLRLTQVATEHVRA